MCLTFYLYLLEEKYWKSTEIKILGEVRYTISYFVYIFVHILKFVDTYF